MQPIRSVSVLVPTYQGIEFLERQLRALASQRIDLPWDYFAVDSGSTDGTWELLQEWKTKLPVPLATRRIEKVEFDHGDTRNQLAAHSQGDLLVYLTQDAVPISDAWLATLARNFEDPRVGAAYCRNAARESASVETRLLARGDPGYARGRREVRLPDAAAYAAMSPHERRLLYNFNDVASAVRRELWERHPFPRTPFGEDVLLARAVLEAGFTVVYDDEAAVEHSHDYGADEVFRRGEIDGRFNAEWLDRVCIASAADAETCAERELARDEEELAHEAEELAALGLDRAARESTLTRLRALRSAAFRGLHAGGLAARRRESTRMLARKELSILFVVHGFPPHTWAGTEVYTLNLARALASRGHRVTILARAPETIQGARTAGGVVEGTFEGLRVLSWPRGLAGDSIRESYRDPRAEAMFRALLARERPDVVHFQHLIHLSTHLVHVARELAVPSVITCHDYWSICARVQLVRPDGVRCERNMESGCFLCAREEAMESIPVLAELSRREDVATSSPGAAQFAERERAVLGAYRAADLRISPSRFLRAKLIETAGFDPESFLYSDNGMRTDVVRAVAKKPRPGTVRFGFVGSLVWYKGGEVMLKAMRRLAARARGSKAVLDVHGDFRPESDAHHAELARVAGEGVVFRGRFDNARLSEVYAEIDVLLVPSTWFENSPITIHEALLTGTPVIASDIGGMAEYVKDGVDGLHFRAGDDADLAAKMAAFLDDPALAERLSRAASARSRELKTIEEDAREMEFRYRGLACRRRIAAAPFESRPVLVERAGSETVSQDGEVVAQGPRAVLVRPGAAVEYEILGSGGGMRYLEIEQWLVGDEPSLVLAGRVSIDGSEIGSIAPRHSGGRDQRCTHVFELDLSTDAARLRLEARAPDGSVHLRVARVGVVLAHRGESEEHAPEARASEEHAPEEHASESHAPMREPAVCANYAELGRLAARETRVIERRARGEGASADHRGDPEHADRAYPIAVDAARAVARRGPVEMQGSDLVLVRPGGVVEYDISRSRAGWHVLEIEQQAFAGETGLALAGRVAIDGREAGAISPFVSSGWERRFRRELLIELSAGSHRIALSADDESNPRAGHVRLARLVLRRAATSDRRERA